MRKTASLLPVLFSVAAGIILLAGNYGCANMIPPTGGARDSIPPLLVSATPADSSTNFNAGKITFTFNEFIDQLQDVQQNVIVSPNPKSAPYFDNKLRTVTVKLRDTLEPNTTYSINFGDAIRDINEGNVLKNFTYVFSTGNKIDRFTLSGKVTEAATGKIDTTLLVVLHQNLDDSAVANERPRYITRLDNKGRYTFRNLPAGTFALYALPNDFSRRYNDKSKLFAFADKPVQVSDSTAPVNLFAYAETVKLESQPAQTGGRTQGGRTSARDSALRYTNNVEGKHDITTDLKLTFNRKIAQFDSTKLVLTGKDLQPVQNYTVIRDTNLTTFRIHYNWPLSTPFNLVVLRNAFIDSAGFTTSKNDTIKFTTKTTEEYGLVKLRFTNLDYARSPVLQVVQNNKVVDSAAVTQRDWSKKYFKPGEYELRILFDSNKNGQWDAGEFFGKHRQPEIVIYIADKLVVRANWDNDKEIKF